MAATVDIPAGGYRYIPFAFQYSGGVEALDGFRIERVKFSEPLPLAAGFAWIEDSLGEEGLPLAAFCACELRSPEQFTDTGFIEFNRHYTGTLQRWGVMTRGRQSCGAQQRHPAAAQAGRTQLLRVLLCASRRGASGSFVIAGSGEAGDGPAPYRERTVRYGETSPDAMREKARFVVGRMDERMAALGKTWADTTATQVVHGIRCSHLISPTRSCGAARRSMGWSGTLPVHRSKAWNTRWTVARFPSSTTSWSSATSPPPLSRGCG